MGGRPRCSSGGRPGRRAARAGPLGPRSAAGATAGPPRGSPATRRRPREARVGEYDRRQGERPHGEAADVHGEGDDRTREVDVADPRPQRPLGRRAGGARHGELLRSHEQAGARPIRHGRRVGVAERERLAGDVGAGAAGAQAHGDGDRVERPHEVGDEGVGRVGGRRRRGSPTGARGRRRARACGPRATAPPPGRG